MIFFAHTIREEEEVEGEEDASLDDSLLSELDSLDDDEDDLTEGFGEIPEDEEKAIEKAGDERTEDDDDEEDLEEDAEDVDYDTYDDVDEM